MAQKFPILLLEDEQATADIIQRVAKNSFPEAVFIQVTNFESALNYLYHLEGLGPKLALVDINLAGDKTGLDFLRLMKEHEIGRLVPVVILSASELGKDMLEAYQLGASSFTNKPFTLDGWKNFVALLRSYWYETVRLPETYFERGQWDQS